MKGGETMPRYRVKDRETGKSKIVEADSAQEAAVKAGLKADTVFVRRLSGNSNQTVLPFDNTKGG
jgi:hypothetical protein